MSVESSYADTQPIGTEDAIRAFLELVTRHPEKPPKTQRAQRENQMLIIGFNRAQETLRTILAQSDVEQVRALSEVRSDGQERPIQIGDVKAWVAS